MKTLSKRYVTIEEAKKYGFELTGYNERDLKEKTEGLKEFAKFAELIPCVTFNTQEEKPYFECVNVLIKFNGYLLQPTKPYNKNVYRFYLVECLHISDYRNENQEPNQIGKPTEKKLNDWLNYLLDEETEKAEKQAKRNEKETEFLNRLNASGQKIRWLINKKSGWIENELIEYSFEIFDSGYISEQITPRKRDLDSFLTLIK